MTKLFKLTIATALLAGTCAMSAPARAQDDGGYCREYTRNVVIGGQVQHAYGTACRQEDGTWQIQNQQVNGQTEAAVPPPPEASKVQYLIHDEQPTYVQPTYVQYAPAYDPYAYEYSYPFVGYYGGYGYDHWHGGGYYGGYHGGYGGGYHGGYGGGYHH